MHDVVAVAAQLRIGVSHLRYDDVYKRVQERLGHPQLLAVTHRAPHDLAQHVAAPFVRRDHAVGDQERHRAQVIGDDAHGDVGRIVERRGVPAPRPRANGVEDRGEQIGVVVRELALDYRGDPLKSHAGVDRRRRQRVELAVPLAIELHEHVVPDFDVAVAAALEADAGAAPRFDLAGHLVAAEVVDLGAAAAGAGLAHLPEVLGEPELGDAVGRYERLPDRVGLLVARDAGVPLEDRREQPFRRQVPHRRQQLPRKRDCVLLEVVAEGEVAEHLEERVMTQRGTDVVEVVVLAADTHARLRGRRPPVGALLLAEEHVLELVHARVGEQQRRIVGGHQRRAGDDGVAVRLEVLQEAAANFSRGHLDIVTKQFNMAELRGRNRRVTMWLHGRPFPRRR